MKQIYFLLTITSIILFSCKKENTVDQAKIDREIIQKYIKDSSLTADSTTTGLYYAISDTGNGNYPTVDAYISIHYNGYLIDGTIFDQTIGAPRSFYLRELIKGWQEGIPKIKKGGKIKLLIPSALGYGSEPRSGIPANSVLIFDIALDNF